MDTSLVQREDEEPTAYVELDDNQLDENEIKLGNLDFSETESISYGEIHSSRSAIQKGSEAKIVDKPIKIVLAQDQDNQPPPFYRATNKPPASLNMPNLSTIDYTNDPSQQVVYSNPNDSKRAKPRPNRARNSLVFSIFKLAFAILTLLLLVAILALLIAFFVVCKPYL
jgi:hypothetical protein